MHTLGCVFETAAAGTRQDVTAPTPNVAKVLSTVYLQPLCMEAQEHTNDHGPSVRIQRGVMEVLH
jgi:hypothetical protein